jgi:DNA-binding LacI/PurR family transcriptional regulator
MNRLPQRVSLVAQTASVLMEEIRRGRWGDTLPGEYALCAQLHVGRKTLRAALERLRQQGVLKCRRGFRRKIVSPKLAKMRRLGNRVVLLMPAALEASNPFVLFLVYRLRQHLAEEGCRLETQVSPALYRARGPLGLETLSKTLHPAGWVLLHSTEPMQRWFAARLLPCVVVGSRYPGIRLSCVDMDYEAVCLHAVNQFVSHGHRRLVLVNPHAAAAGDARTETGFLQAVAQQKTGGIQAEVVKHDGTVSGICLRVDTLRARAQPPTAFLVSRAPHFLTVLTHLLSRRVRVPGDVALICREHDPALEAVVPSVARYSHNPAAFAANASRLVMGMIRGTGRIEECRITLNFIRGETLG